MGIFNFLNKKQNEKDNVIIVVPLISVNGIEFGTSRDELWRRIGNPKKSFKKTPTSSTETDIYENYHIYYDNNYNFEAIEVFGQIDIYYNNEKLPKSYSKILEYFKNKYDDIEEDVDGFISHKGSIGVYVENEDDYIDAILFAKKNYYNDN